MQGDGYSNQPDVVIILQNICISKHQLHMYNFYLSTLSQESWGKKNCNKWHPHEAVFNRNIPRGHLQINGTTIKINEKIKWK